MSKHITVSVINDMSTDQRVDRICRSLARRGFDITVICRSLPDSLLLNRPYTVERMRLLFRRGPLFYLEFNLRLFLRLSARKRDILLANDLDTLLANYLALRLGRARQLLYDSHEYFTEVPELQGRAARKVWLLLERWIFPRLRHAYTVNESIAQIYRDKYGVPVGVVRNLPDTRRLPAKVERSALGLPEDKRILILQGAGINVDRGGEEAVLAMTHLDDTYLLLVIGGGDAYQGMQELAAAQGIGDRVRFLPRMPYEELMQYTCCADLGLSLDKPGSGNYDLALPNKIFDSLAAGNPVLIGPTKEARRVVEAHDVGAVLDEVSPETVASGVKAMFENTARMAELRSNAKKASAGLNWPTEEKRLFEIFERLD